MKQHVLGFLVVASIAGAPLRANPVADEKEMLEGEWLLTSVEVQGKTLPAPVDKGGSIVFDKDGKLILKDPGKPDKIGKYKIDADKTPKQIDLIESKDAEVMQGIYEFDEEKLKMAFSAQGPKGKRPNEFKGEKVMIVYWKRQKP